MLGFISESDNEKGGGSWPGIRASSPVEGARRHPCKPWVGFCLDEILRPQRGHVTSVGPTNRNTAIGGNPGASPTARIGPGEGCRSVCGSLMPPANPTEPG